MKKVSLVCVFICSFFGGIAQTVQDTLLLNIPGISEDSLVSRKTLLYIDSTASLPVSEVLKKDFIPLKSFPYRLTLPPRMVEYKYYLKLSLTNESDSEVMAYLYPGTYYNKADLYKITNTAELVNNSDSIEGYKKFSMAPGEKYQVLIGLTPLKCEFNSITPFIIKSHFIEAYKSFLVSHRNEVIVFGYIVSGILLMMILFMLSNFLISRSMEFLYNAIYSICMFLLIFFNAHAARTSTSFTNLYYSYIDFFLMVCGTLFYIAFTRRFLNTKNNYTGLDNVLKLGERFVFLLFCVYTYLNFFTKTYAPQYYLENFLKILILTIGVAFIFLALRKKDKLFTYLAAGNAMLVLFSIISLTIILASVRSSSLFSASTFYYNIGIVLELIFFLLGLSYKNRKELINRIKEQEALKMAAEKQEYAKKIELIEARQEIKNRISADMHDDLGAGMTSIRLYSELAKRKLQNNPIPEIDKISNSADELLVKMNGIIWSMNSSNDTLNNMIAYIRSYALEYFEDTGILCKITLPENLPNIEVIGEIRRNVFMVIKEALNNILKHSKATEVHIDLQRTTEGLALYVQDNGTGINFEKIRQFGNGLKNMKKRMEAVGIEFYIENKNGTRITLLRKIEGF